VGILSIIIAFVAALLALYGIITDDSGAGNGGKGAGIAAIGIVGLFASVFVGSLAH